MKPECVTPQPIHQSPHSDCGPAAAPSNFQNAPQKAAGEELAKQAPALEEADGRAGAAARRVRGGNEKLRGVVLQARGAGRGGRGGMHVCVLCAACCVLRVACCVLCVACCLARTFLWAIASGKKTAMTPRGGNVPTSLPTPPPAGPRPAPHHSTSLAAGQGQPQLLHLPDAAPRPAGRRGVHRWRREGGL